MKEGWEIKKLGEVCEIVGGSTPKTNEPAYWDGEHSWVTPAELDGSKYISSTARKITDCGVKSAHLQLLPKGTVLLSSRAPIGKVAITTIPMYCNQGFKNLIPHDDKDSLYLYYYIKHHVKQIEQLGTGTTFKEVSREDLCKFPILTPSNTRGYTQWVGVMTQIANKQFILTKEVESLTKQREELLPLLMNGQVSVNYHLSHD